MTNVQGVNPEDVHSGSSGLSVVTNIILYIVPILGCSADVQRGSTSMTNVQGVNPGMF